MNTDGNQKQTNVYDVLLVAYVYLNFNIFNAFILHVEGTIIC